MTKRLLSLAMICIMVVLSNTMFGQSSKAEAQSAPRPQGESQFFSLNENRNGGTAKSSEEGFEGDFPPACWTQIDADGDGNAFFQYGVEDSAFEGEFSAASASWQGGVALTPDNYLVSPPLSIGENEVFSYYVGAQDPDWPAENYGIYISTTGNEEADFDTELFTETLEDNVWVQREIDLSAYANMEIYLAIRHYGVTDQFYIKFDQLVLPGDIAECTDCGEFTAPELANQSISCDESGWYYNAEVTTAGSEEYTLTNSGNGEEVVIDGEMMISVGPFNNGETVDFSIFPTSAPECEVVTPIVGDCTSPCVTAAANSTYNWVDDMLMTIPTVDENNECEAQTFEGWEIWGGEAYVFDGLATGVMYQFDVCTGANAGSFETEMAVLDPNENVVAQETIDGCSIAFPVEMDGAYTVVVTNPGYCGLLFNVDNGNPRLSCMGTVGIDELQKVELNVYPNPAQNNLQIQSEMSGLSNIIIFDAVGRVVKNERANINGNYVLNINDLSNGIYTVQISNDTEIAMVKFIKE